MDISVVSPGSLRIKGKTTTLVNSPALIRTKTPSDAVLLMTTKEEPTTEKIEGCRVVISGHGEYEIGGAKISGFKTNEDIVYSIHIDGLSVLLGRFDAIERVKEKLAKHHVLILFVDGKLQEESIAVFEPNVILLAGGGARDAAKSLGKEASTVKYTTTLEKLPAEMEVVVLE